MLDLPFTMTPSVGIESPGLTTKRSLATGDPGFAEILSFKLDPIGRGLNALEKSSTIFADIKMVEAGIVKKGHMSAVKTFLGSG